MDNIAIITARGGSKRIPKKNIKEFCGKPIISYSIKAALESNIFSEVMVSTDDLKIATIAKEYGAMIPFLRSENTSGDFATTADVLREVLVEYKKQGKIFTWMCCLYPTAPFVTAKKLKVAFSKLEASNSGGLIPVVKFSYPPQRGFVIKNDKLEYKWPQYMRSRSQDLEPYYHDAGQFYFWRVAEFLKAKDGMPNDVLPLIVDENEVQDIDNLSDWQLAELKYHAMQEK
jgi:pseudaminic acid cytidylyltransferase